MSAILDPADCLCIDGCGCPSCPQNRQNRLRLSGSFNEALSPRHCEPPVDGEEPASWKRYIGVIALCVALLTSSSQNAVYKMLVEQDPETFNACNTLCGSNIFGVVTLTPLFARDLTLQKLKAITRVQWAALVAGTLCISVFGPLLQLQALKSITVASAAILARLQSVLFLILAMLFLGEDADCWSFTNAATTFVGITLAIVTTPIFGEPLEFTSGYILMVGAVGFFTLALFITKKWCSDIPMGILGVFRVLGGTIIYHSIVLIQETDPLTSKIFTLEFWKKMWWFSLLYVTLFQATWLYALLHCSPVAISVGTSTLFVLTLTWAMPLLDSFPTGPQWIGSVFIIAAALSSTIKALRQPPVDAADAYKFEGSASAEPWSPQTLSEALDPEGEMTRESNPSREDPLPGTGYAAVKGEDHQVPDSALGR